jgi:hypothetical protein
MPILVLSEADVTAAGKFGLQRRHNADPGLLSLQAFVLLLDPETALPVACLTELHATRLQGAKSLRRALSASSPSFMASGCSRDRLFSLWGRTSRAGWRSI